MADQYPKYRTVAELAQAYRDGELSAPLMLDNDSTDVYDEAADEDVFSMHPYDVMIQALALLGIPTDEV